MLSNEDSIPVQLEKESIICIGDGGVCREGGRNMIHFTFHVDAFGREGMT